MIYSTKSQIIIRIFIDKNYIIIKEYNILKFFNHYIHNKLIRNKF